MAKEYIERNEAIKELRDVYEFENPTASGAFDEYATMLVPRVLKNLPTADVVDRPKWISVKERLPEGDTRVLVYLANNQTSYTQVDTDRIVNRRWVRWGENVTHWMPIPELQEGGAKE